MTDDHIAEIRARHAQSDSNYIELESKWDIHADRAWLLDKVERMRCALQEVACTCSSTRECVSLWDWDGKCRHFNARAELNR